MFTTSPQDSSAIEIKEFVRNIFGYRPRRVELYKMALLHRSQTKYDNIVGKLNNERLEYLGDAVLSAITADFLFRKFPLQAEGTLTELRSKIVCRENLNALSRRIGLDKLMKIDNNIHARSADGDAFEAFMGAMYLDLGYRRTKKIFIKHILQMQIDLDSLFAQEKNFKSKAINWAQKHHKQISFEHEERNNKPMKLYIASVLIEGKMEAKGEGTNIKQAEQAAAQSFCTKLEEEGLMESEFKGEFTHWH